MAEISEVVAALMRTQVFRKRVETIILTKAASVLGEETPDADQLAWAKAVVQGGYDASTEAKLILEATKPATITGAIEAADADYITAFNAVFAKAVLAKS